MLKMLKLQGKFGGEVEGWNFPLQLQHLQHLHHFQGNVEVWGFLTSTSSAFPPILSTLWWKVLETGEMLKLQALEDVEVRKPKTSIFPGKWWRCWRCWICRGIFGGRGGVQVSPATSTSSTFPGKCWSFGFSNFNIFNISPVLKVLKTGEMLKMLKFGGSQPTFPLQLQHLQHLQHKIGPLQLQHLRHFPCFEHWCSKTLQK